MFDIELDIELDIEIDVDVEIEIFLGAGNRGGTCIALHAGIVERRVEASERGDRCRHQGLDLGALGNIAAHKGRLSAGLPDQLDGLFTAADIDVGHHHPGAFTRKNKRGLTSDAGTRTRDQCNLVL